VHDLGIRSIHVYSPSIIYQSLSFHVCPGNLIGFFVTEVDAWIGVVCAKLVVHGLEELRCVDYAESIGEDGTVVVCDSFG
jgi:hypothetical protein